jgi:hypothetical protein
MNKYDNKKIIKEITKWSFARGGDIDPEALLPHLNERMLDPRNKPWTKTSLQYHLRCGSVMRKALYAELGVADNNQRVSTTVKQGYKASLTMIQPTFGFPPGGKKHEPVIKPLAVLSREPAVSHPNAADLEASTKIKENDTRPEPEWISNVRAILEVKVPHDVRKRLIHELTGKTT